MVVEHVVGPRGWTEGLAGGVSPDDAPERTVAAAPGVEYRAVKYEADMPTVLRAADLVVCRAGATSVAELSALGVPSILVPLPGAPGDHQTATLATSRTQVERYSFPTQSWTVIGWDWRWRPSWPIPGGWQRWPTEPAPLGGRMLRTGWSP